MGKKIFLTSDGFSFHTLELRWNPTDTAFANAFDRLRQCSCGGEFYPVKECSCTVRKQATENKR